MTQLYKKNGAVFIPAGITVEEVERIEKENEGLKAFESHCDEIEEDAKFIAKENAELKSQIEKMKNVIYEKINFCSFCPLKECKNAEGTCPYLHLSEEEEKKILTDWIMGS